MSGVHRVARRAAYVLLAAGLLAVGYSAYVVGAARVYQAVEQHRFEETSAQQASVRSTKAAVAVAAAPVEGGLVGEMQIPRLGLTAMVVQGDSAAILRRAVGHLADTALPGESGNVVLAGHRDTFFRPLRLLRVGDAITMKTRNGDFEYLVESTAVVPPTDVRVLEPTGDRTLTLITCYPFYYVGPAPDRFIVRARQTAAPR
ncbi:MAG TPA: class D sortase [Vicinamibacterales bacterium]|nr:class D sortase [Vicinamibacterales bacterium]